MDIRIAYLVAIVIGVSLSSPILRNSEAVNEVRINVLLSTVRTMN